MEASSWSKADWVFTSSYYNQGKSRGQRTTLLKIFFLHKWLFQWFSKVSAISEHQTKTVFTQLCYCFFRLCWYFAQESQTSDCLAWLQQDGNTNWHDWKRFGKASVKNGKTGKNICCFFGELIHGSSPSVLSCRLLLFPTDVRMTMWVWWQPWCTQGSLQKVWAWTALPKSVMFHLNFLVFAEVVFPTCKHEQNKKNLFSPTN